MWHLFIYFTFIRVNSDTSVSKMTSQLTKDRRLNRDSSGRFRETKHYLVINSRYSKSYCSLPLENLIRSNSHAEISQWNSIHVFWLMKFLSVHHFCLCLYTPQLSVVCYRFCGHRWEIMKAVLLGSLEISSNAYSLNPNWKLHQKKTIAIALLGKASTACWTCVHDAAPFPYRVA